MVRGGIRGRGRGRGTGRGSVRWQPSQSVEQSTNAESTPPVALPADRDIMAGLRPTPVGTLPVPRAHAGNAAVVIADVKQLGSCNWTGADTPTIVVPGTPRAWAEPALPLQVEPDTGVIWDQDALSAPAGKTLVALIATVDKTHAIQCRTAHAPEMPFDWAGEQIDFVTDRTNLRKLLRWINVNVQPPDDRDPGDDRQRKDWRINMQLAPGGRTVLFERWEKRDYTAMSGFTFGFNFETASTTAPRGAPQSSWHHRIVSYNLNGLKIVVRFEVDAYIPAPIHRSSAGARSRADETSSQLEDLAAQLATTTIAQSAPGPAATDVEHDFGVSPTSTRATASPEPFVQDHGITVIEGGTHIPQAALVELTTRSAFRAQEINWAEDFPQIFLTQTPHHFLGVHHRGQFGRVIKRRLGAGELAQVEQDLQPSLLMLVGALKEIAALVRAGGARGRLTLVCRAGRVQVYERESMESVLPDEMLERFEG
ncbi:hypothetical protein MIND_01304000 [Mycena indigotica]|uniref:Uncharacterized protein n=1 Tax=Mycena indigotica TaxID=2126181 RepID=A0A8H6S0Z8_9AGAR|nr:uncharacterized protein MIND_01304000 [Mycena indigotica]KAF7290638.1 hypothetical protein MIND_01304000 [Mycena indigotica]